MREIRASDMGNPSWAKDAVMEVARPQAAGCGKAGVFNGDSSGSALKPQETSISSREAQRAHRQQMEAERCATVNTSDLHYIFLIH